MSPYAPITSMTAGGTQVTLTTRPKISVASDTTTPIVRVADRHTTTPPPPPADGAPRRSSHNSGPNTTPATPPMTSTTALIDPR